MFEELFLSFESDMNAQEINGFMVNMLNYENVDCSHLRLSETVEPVDKSTITLVVCLASADKLSFS